MVNILASTTLPPYASGACYRNTQIPQNPNTLNTLNDIHPAAQFMNTADRKAQLIAIDLDGTLVDSVADLHAAVARMQTELGHVPASMESVRCWVGNGIERLVHRALTQSMQRDADAELFSLAIKRFDRAYAELNGSYSTLYPGVAQGLDWLTAQDIPLVCVTNKAGRFSRALLESLDIAHYFSFQIAGDDVIDNKPHPAALLKAMQLCNACASQSIMIGDSLHDIRAARAAGFSMIGVSYGYNHGQPISGLQGSDQPDFIIDSFSEIPDCIDRLHKESRNQGIKESRNQIIKS